MAAAVPFIVAGGSLLSVREQRKARKEQRRASAIEARMAEVRNLRERRRALAARQRAAAEAATAGVQTGITPTSGVVTAETVSAGAQFGSNVGFAQELAQLNAERRNSLEVAGERLARASTFEAVASAATGFK